MKVLPVTIVTGFVGAGKTSLVNHLLNNRAGRKVAVLINSARAVDVTRQLLLQPEAALTTDDALIAMLRGCVCCTMQDEMVIKVIELATSKKFDHLILEAAGIADVVDLAARFVRVEESGVSLSQFARIDTIVNVVDCRTFIDGYSKGYYLIERGFAIEATDTRTVADVLLGGIEFANVIALNKTDQLPEEYVGTISAMLRAFNPEAEVIPTTQGVVPLEKVIGARQFHFETLEAVTEYAHDRNALATEPDHGVSSFVYAARRPFHPERFLAFLKTPHQDLLRIKGLFWLCTRMAEAGRLGVSGGGYEIESAGYWLAALSEEEARADAAAWEAVQPIWDADWGDRRQELAFIGYKMDHAALIRGLDAALLTDAEMQQSPAAWAVLEDGFGEW